MLSQLRHGSVAVSAQADPGTNGLDLLRLRLSRKVVTVRKQIELGTYSIDRRLDVVLEKILLDLA